jgi:hypothetical protein
MWRLKIADGGKDPYIFSINNFVGRQIWEFDPQAGTPEERAKVEEARQNFYNNRFQVKPSSDLLWRMQVPLYSLSWYIIIISSALKTTTLTPMGWLRFDFIEFKQFIGAGFFTNRVEKMFCMVF